MQQIMDFNKLVSEEKAKSFKEGYAKGLQEGNKDLKPKLHEWIPALVIYQNPPSWWSKGKAEENKKALMGTVILVFKYNSNYHSKRNDDTGEGLYHWSKGDLILYPTILDIELQKSQGWMFK